MSQKLEDQTYNGTSCYMITKLIVNIKSISSWKYDITTAITITTSTIKTTIQSLETQGKNLTIPIPE